MVINNELGFEKKREKEKGKEEKGNLSRNEKRVLRLDDLGVIL